MTDQKVYSVEYNSNNSGGSWWLKDEDWRALEAAGWSVAWLGLRFCNERYPIGQKGGRPAPDVHETNECPGHLAADTYEEAVAAGPDARWLGSLAREATIDVEAYSSTLAEGVAEAWWGETLPDQNASDPGCSCCGSPHSFYAREKLAVPA